MKTLPKPPPKNPKTEEHFRFDPEGHKYLAGKKRVPAVSDILAKVGLSRDYKGIDPFYRDRGIACHKAIELYLKGTLDPVSLDPAIQEQFKAFMHYWEKHLSERILALERPFCDISENFAGTPDLVTDKAIYDWKCSKDHDPVADLQGQAYKTLVVHSELSLLLPFIVVELHDDGSYEEFNYGVNIQEWSHVMGLYDWKIGGSRARRTRT